MARQDERERIRHRLGALTARVDASKHAGDPSVPPALTHPRGAVTRGGVSAARRRTGAGGFGLSGGLPGHTARGVGNSARGPARPPDVASSEDESSSGNWDLESLAPGLNRPESAAAPDESALGAAAQERDEAGGFGGHARERSADRWLGTGEVDGFGRQSDSGHGGARSPEAGVDVREAPVPGWLAGEGERFGWAERFVPERFRGMRVDPGRRGVVALAGVGLLAVIVAMVVVLRERPVAQPVPPLPAVSSSATSAMPAQVPAASVAVGEQAELVVSVVGLVHRGGLVRLPPGARVADALTAAGGARDGADLTGLNLAQRLNDGDQILVGPAQGDGTPRLGSATISGPGATPPSAGSTPAGRVDLNTATESQLDALPGVGPVTAAAIITWRTTNGRFTSVDQLAEVDGIGPTRLARLRDLVTV